MFKNIDKLTSKEEMEMINTLRDCVDDLKSLAHSEAEESEESVILNQLLIDADQKIRIAEATANLMGNPEFDKLFSRYIAGEILADDLLDAINY